MIVLIRDFPNISADSINIYLNSKYMLNYQYAKKVSKRTVQCYLLKLRFSVKIVSFAPSNRNNICLWIYRSAWCRIIDDIQKIDDVLIAFVDEAAITTCEGRKYGRAYASITTVLIVPPNKTTDIFIQMAILCY